MEEVIREGRSLAETPTWSVATVTSLMVFICFLVQRCIYWFGKVRKYQELKKIFCTFSLFETEGVLMFVSAVVEED